MPKGIYERTDVMRKNMSVAQRAVGRTSVPAGCRNTGKTHFKKGYVPWNKGGTLSAEHKKKLSVARMGIPAWNKGMYGINRGEDNPNWKGGYSANYRLRRTQEYKNWRNEVFKRDNYKCTMCGTNGYITAHHVKSLARYPELALNIDNGLTLCESCHVMTDNYRGRAKGGQDVRK